MSEFFTLAQIDEAAEAIRNRTHHRPKIALILGSGLGGWQMRSASRTSYRMRKFLTGIGRPFRVMPGDWSSVTWKKNR